ncbi:MAG: outer membrane beta-barrel protein, partial [Flavobacteriaceae bacterium]|nr:outer membrane beta-barrel protein [Flavobacteriaceae bacterium]
KHLSFTLPPLTFGDRFYVQPGFQYSILTTKVVNKSTSTGIKLIDETTLKAVSIPLKVGFRLIDPEAENIFNIRVFGGFDGHHILSVDHSTKSGHVDDISTDDYNNLIVNADFGVGLDLLFFFIDAGYQIGLTPVHSGADNAKSSAFYSNLGIRLSL